MIEKLLIDGVEVIVVRIDSSMNLQKQTSNLDRLSSMFPKTRIIQIDDNGYIQIRNIEG